MKKYIGYLTKSGRYISTSLHFDIDGWDYKIIAIPYGGGA